MKRRQFLQWLTGAGIAASGLIVPHRTIFLPPSGGWPHGRIAHASLIIPRDDIGMWATEIAAGRMAYDEKTETLSLIEWDERRNDPALDEVARMKAMQEMDGSWIDEPFVAISEPTVPQIKEIPLSNGRVLRYDDRSVFAQHGTQMLVYRGDAHKREMNMQLRWMERDGVPLPPDYT